jgi:5-methylcytosine-specific restriction endonuclease McrA
MAHSRRRGKKLKKLVRKKKANCHYCGVRLALTTAKTERAATWDHVIPLSKGGYDKMNNLVPCCRKCNQRKGSKMPDELLAALTPSREADNEKS